MPLFAQANSWKAMACFASPGLLDDGTLHVQSVCTRKDMFQMVLCQFLQDGIWPEQIPAEKARA